RVLTGKAPALLEQQAVARAGAPQFVRDRGLGLAVGGRDEIGRSLHRDLEVLDFAEVARENPSRLAGGTDHDVEERGSGHFFPRISGRPAIDGRVDGTASAAIA